MNRIEKSAAYLSGVSLELLARCPLHDQQKYPNLGMMVAIVGVFAFISATFGLSSVFGLSIQVVLVGVLWSLIIMLIDRLLIMTFPKLASPWRQAMHALPRFLLAGAIGVVVAHPLQLAIFWPEIKEAHYEKWLEKKDKRDFMHAQDELGIGELERIEKDNLTENKIYNSLNVQGAELAKSMQSCAEATERRRMDVRSQCPGNCADNRASCDNEYCSGLSWQVTLKQRECNELQAAFKKNQDELSQITRQLLEKTGEVTKSAKKDKETAKGIHAEEQRNLKSVDALGLLTSTDILFEVIDKEKAWGIYFAVMALFIFVEVVLIMIKLIIPVDSYDRLVAENASQFSLILPALVSKELLPSGYVLPTSGVVQSMSTAQPAAPKPWREAGAEPGDLIMLFQVLGYVLLITVAITMVFEYFGVPNERAGIVATVFGGATGAVAAVVVRNKYGSS